MSVVEVLFRDSSAADGVQSRGAGWHRRREQKGTTGLAEGDLVMTREPMQTVYVCAGRALVKVPSPQALLRAYYISSPSGVLATGSTNQEPEALQSDWVAFWESMPHASWLLWVIHQGQLLAPLVAAASDCAETVLRFVPKGRVGPSRALRIARCWLRECASRDRLEASSDAVFLNALHGSLAAEDSAELSAASATDLSVATYTADHVLDAVHYALGASSDRAQGSRSLAFLVRARVSLWRVLLALSRR